MQELEAFCTHVAACRLDLCRLGCLGLRIASQSDRVPEVLVHCSVRGSAGVVGDDDALAVLFDDLNCTYWDGRLPSVRLRWSKRLHASAGLYSPSRREIVVSTRYYEHYPEDLEAVLKHEMVHVWLHGQRLRGRLVGEKPHGPAFRSEAVRVGAPLRMKSYPGRHRAFKYEWECPACGRKVKSRKWITSACRSCCEIHSNGVYSEEYRFRLLREF